MEKVKKIFSRKRNIVFTIVLAILLIVVIGVVSITSNVSNARAGMNSAVSAKADKGSIQETVIGTGTLTNDTVNEVEVPVGLEVEKVLVEQGDKVKKGTPIARVTEISIKENILEIQQAIDTLKDEIDNLDKDDDYYSITNDVKNAEKEKLEKTLSEMKDLLKDRELTSSYAGIVDTVNLADDTVIEKNTISTDSSASESSNVDPSSYNLNGMSSQADNEIQFMTLSNTQSDKAADKTVTELYGTLSLSVTKPVKGATPQSSLRIDESTSQFSGSISWSPADRTFAANTSYTAVIYLTAADGYAFASDTSRLNIVIDSHATPKVKLMDLDSDGYTETIKITAAYPATGAESSQSGGAGSGNAGGTANGTGNQDQSATIPDGVGSTDISAAGASSYGSSDSGISGTDISGGTGSVDSVGSSSYDVYKTAGITVIPEDNMVLNISVDELDILSISEGQKVDIELDAVSDEVFAGEITAIAADAASTGGVSKYDVEVTLKRTESMKAGMSASATIIVNEQSDTLLIPMDALQEVDGEVFVYTSVSKNNELESPVAVETGLSNSDSVEIISGLSEGQEVYYQEKVIENTDSFGMMGGGSINRDQGGSSDGDQGGEEE